jgi:glutaredoxin
MNGDMLSGLTGKLRSLAHQQLAAREADGPLVRRLRDVVSTVNDLLGKPIRPDAAGADSAVDSSTGGGPVVVTPVVREQAPVIVYFDGKDQRTRIKVEELLNAREIKFRILDVTNDEAERSWVITAAKSEEFPIVVVAGTPVGGFHELMQLDVSGDLKKRVFGS